MTVFSSHLTKRYSIAAFSVIAAGGLWGCASAPKPEIRVTDSYQFNFSSKSGSSLWQKTLNKGLCQVQVSAQFDKVYTQSAREAVIEAESTQDAPDSMSIPYLRLSLMNDEAHNKPHNEQQKHFSLTAQYDADSSQVRFYLSHANGGGEYLPYTTRLQQGFSILMQPFAKGDIGLNVTDAAVLNSSANQAGYNAQEPVKYHAYPEFLAQKVLLEVFASDVEVTLLDVITGCE
ncbi:hypothetical protein KIH87_07710 [Paraneptunicella aestuarii]|uniref:hypothetical protein n=1 Tax=Paraneptunicella aestuarii TaxID=2831148 RepID=UPI001E4A0BFC|nr:hypothetical protein [Paraneptunicella aestuarii]UAA40215.1 hypothetical protein KIH87_07710 [Paraneptunicella aestuarii]